MPEELHDSREKLSKAIRSAVHYLQSRGYTYKKIGVHMGYPETTAKCHVSQFVNDGRIPPGLELLRLSQLASSEDHDDLAELFSTPAKKVVPSTAGEEEPNLSLLEENQTITVSLGRAVAAFNEGDVQTAQAAFRQSMAAHFDALKEVHAFAALRASRGDGSPAIMPNARVATI